MDITQWFLYGVSNKFIEGYRGDNKCEFGFEITLGKEMIDQPVFNNVTDWYVKGFNLGWIKKAGCVKHELEYPTAVLKRFLHADIKELNIVKPEFDSFNGITSLINKKDGYFPSYPESVELLIKESQFNPSKTFIDIGCGKGLPFYIASKFDIYSSYIGIDVDQKCLNECLVNNILIKDKINLFNTGASDYILPNTNCHIYIFNPFDNEILTTFLNNNHKTIKENNSLILYNNDYIAKHVILSFGFKIIKSFNQNLSIYQ